MIYNYEFQFLDRNSFGSDAKAGALTRLLSRVSIPRSEFFRFGHSQGEGQMIYNYEFQFLDRNSFGSD